MTGFHDFDTRGFYFALKCLAVIIFLFAGVKYGTAFAQDRILAEATEGLAETEMQLLEHKIKRSLKSLSEIEIIQKLEAFEGTLATRSIDSASVETLSRAHQRLIAADLDAMKLYLYEDGHATVTIDILSKGKRGSRWETPTGLYNIQTKEYNHFSSIGAVDMPFSMQFFGNYFIHGWPTYPGGEPVPEGFSGGCIRLSTLDAQRVFNFASLGTPILIWDAESDAPLFTTTSAPPQVGALSYIVADVRSGTVYAEKDANTARPIASITKILTALVANETIHYDRAVTVSSDDRKETEGTPGQIMGNNTFTVGDLLYALLMESNNSVAYTLARYYGEALFVQWINDKARAIGMEHAHFADPSGLSPENKASASDLFRLIRYVHNSQSYILNITREQKKTIQSDEGRSYTLSNLNHFAGNPQFLGGKSGYTDEAKQTMTTIFELPISGATATVSIVVLGTNDRKADVEALLAWFKRSAELSTSAPTTTFPLQ